MKNAFKRSRRLLLAGLLAAAAGCDSNPSTPDAGVGGHAAGGAGGHAAGGAAGQAAGGSGGGVGGGGGSSSAGAGGTAGTAGAGGAAGASGSAGAGGTSGPQEFTAFVNDLIKNKTASNTSPETLNDKTFTDSMDPAAFMSLFP